MAIGLSMTSEEQSVGERRHSTRESIDRLLADRQEMWVLYERLAGVDPYGKEPQPSALKTFVQILVDYIASAHFGLYQRIVNGQERRKGVVTLAKALYPKISSSTDAAVAFNDKYESYDLEGSTDELVSDLSTLGENLAARIELEDQLIAELLT